MHGSVYLLDGITGGFNNSEKRLDKNWVSFSPGNNCQKDYVAGFFFAEIGLVMPYMYMHEMEAFAMPAVSLPQMWHNQPFKSVPNISELEMKATYLSGDLKYL